MGFYAPAQIVRDAREHGVEVRAVDINFSDWDATLEDSPPPCGEARFSPCGRGVGGGTFEARLRSLRPLWPPPSSRPSADAEGLPLQGGRESCSPPPPRRASPRHPHRAAPSGSASARSRAFARRTPSCSSRRAHRPYTACATSGCAPAFRAPGWSGSPRRTPSAPSGSTGAPRCGRCARSMRRTAAERLPLFAGAADLHREERRWTLPPMPLGEHVVNDYRSLSLSLKAHPVSFLRRELAAGASSRRGAPRLTSGRRVTVAGPRPGPPAAGHGVGRHLHHARGRDRHRQHHRLAEGVRAIPRRSCSARASSR